MSGTQVSSAPNVLFDPMMAIHQQEGQNQLLLQQQDIGGHEMEMAGRLAGTLMDKSLYPTPEARAAAYPTLLANARAAAPGYFKNAPATYPGDDQTQALAGMSLSLKDRYTLGLTTPPGTQEAINAALRPGSQPATTSTGSGGGGGGVAAPNTGGATIGQRQNNPGNLTFAGQPYASPGQGNRFASFPDMATGVAANADQLSLYQTQHGINTVRGAVTRWVGDPKADLTSYVSDIAKSLGVGPDDKIDLTDPAVQAKFIQAQFPHESAGGGYVLNPADVAKGVQMAAARRGQQVQPPPPAAVAAVPGPPAAPGTPATPPPYRVAGAMQPPPGTAAAPGQVAPVPGQPAAPGGATTAQQPPAQAAQPGGGQPATRANLPHAADVPTGVNTPQYQQAADLQRKALTLEAQVDPTGRLKQIAAGLRQQAQQLLQTDSVVQTQEGQLHPITGKMDDPTKPNANYVWSPEQRSYIDTTGTHPPVTPPSPRFSPPTVDPSTGKPAIAVEGGQGGTTYLPIPERPAAGSYEQQAQAYHADIPIAAARSTAGQAAQNSMLQLNELADIIAKGQGTGPEGQVRARVAAYMEQHGWAPETIKSITGMSSGSDAEMLQKLAVATVGANAKSDLGSNVGIQSLELYQQANPGLSMLSDANKKVTNMIRVAKALADDYTQGSQQHFNKNQTSFLHNGPYDEPLSVFDAKWQAQNNPQVGAAAIGILNGDNYGDWAPRLGSPAEAFRAVQLAARIDPNAVVQTASGPKLAKDILAHPDAPAGR